MGSKHSQFGCVSAPADIGESRSHSASRSPVKASALQSTITLRSLSNSSVSSESPSTILEDTNEAEPIESSSPFSAMIAELKEDCLYRPSMKLLFLDVDGVLNNGSTPWDEYHTGLDSKLLKYLKLIVLKTGCKIVLSTTWRLNVDAKRILLSAFKTRMDLDPAAVVLGQTKSLKRHGMHRTNEIEHFLRANRRRIHVVSWCALDDLKLDSYDAHSKQFMRGHFVRTDRRTGLSPQNALSAIDILNAVEIREPYRI